MSGKNKWLHANGILYNEKLAWTLWFGLSVFAVLHTIWFNSINNFIIYRYVYIHLLKGVNLYLPYPEEYNDVNLYGPFFALVIAPFSWLPEKLGAFVWVLFNVSFLLFAIYQLPIQRKWKAALVLLCAHEAMNTSSWLQINSLVCGCILLGFAYTQKGKDGRALFFVMAAAFIKIYGIVGLAFFFFSRRKLAFIGWALLWSSVFFFAPLLLTRFSFLMQCYRDWALALQEKATKNITLDRNHDMQDISVMGMLRRIFYLPHLDDIVVLVPGVVLFLSQYLPFRYHNDLRYQLYILCSVLLSTVIFSSGSESPTYIIAMPGLCLWYLLQPKTKWVNIFFIAVFFITTFSYSDLLTPWFREHVARPYSLKALPSFVVWLVIFIQIYRKQFLQALQPLPAAADK